MISAETYNVIKQNADCLNSAIIYDRDYSYNYFGFKVLAAISNILFGFEHEYYEHCLWSRNILLRQKTTKLEEITTMSSYYVDDGYPTRPEIK